MTDPKPLSNLEDWRLGPYTIHDKWMLMSEEFCSEPQGRCLCPDCIKKRAPFVIERAGKYPQKRQG